MPLAQELLADEALVEDCLRPRRHRPERFPHILANYLAAEKDAGHVAPDVDIDDLLITGQAWPRPDRPHLMRYIAAAARAIAATPSSESGDHHDKHL